MNRKRNSGMMIRNCRFAFKCDAVWENLEQKRNPKVRFCSTCSKNVYRCDDDTELYENMVKNRCVAIFRMEVMLTGMVEYPTNLKD